MAEIRRDELKQMIDSRQTTGEDSPVILIDVREPLEVQTYGAIPSSINIPMNDVGAEISLDSAVFKQKYGKVLNKDKILVFYCRSGARSAESTKVATEKGFTNSINYKGSALEWADIDFNVKKY